VRCGGSPGIGNFVPAQFKKIRVIGVICGQSLFDVNGTGIVIYSFWDEYYAIENHCSHALSAFDNGRMRSYNIICPVYGATFDIRDGSVTGLPASSGIEPLFCPDSVVNRVQKPVMQAEFPLGPEFHGLRTEDVTCPVRRPWNLHVLIFTLQVPDPLK